ncbi:MAG: hypothetical protein OIF40_17070 [Mangrovicoccus sp.]|nr:hypothetical protein [Mangrovicoccus sp.]
MRRGIAITLLALVMPWAAGGQESPANPGETAQDPGKPILQMEFPETEAIPGQPLSLRLTVLVPSFMPDPPIWPSFETPDLMVRLPERATSPTSKQVAGESWSGITRHYRISPMVPGEFTLPAQEMQVVWGGAKPGDVEQITLKTEPVSLRGVVPEGAEDLDPFIAAEGLSLSQEIEGTAEKMQPGDSVKRVITAQVSGVSPIFLPPLMVAADLPGVAAYEDEPLVEEREDRGKLGGTRRESVTYLAEGGGGGSLPDITLKWYNITSGQVETAQIDGVKLDVTGPPAVLADPAARGALIAWAAAALAALGILGLVLRRFWPRFKAGFAAKRAAYEASEPYAWHGVQQAIKQQDLHALHGALDLWAMRHDGKDPRQSPRVEQALCNLGASQYAAHGASAAAQSWTKLEQALSELRESYRYHGTTSSLPPLNPA